MQSPVCAGCGCVVAYPSGFELDHIQPLADGGLDTEDNCQILCVQRVATADGIELSGCHAEKTRREAKARGG